MQASRRPADTPFKQQRLNAWQPILTPTWVISTFLLIGIIFIPVGVTLLNQSNNVVEESYMYDGAGAVNTACKITANNAGRLCQIEIDVTKDMKAPVYVYYELTNFYQNHRKYVKSLSFAQLRGEAVTADEIHEDCKPLDKVTPSGGGAELTLNPCGLIANSFFNDVISLATAASTPPQTQTFGTLDQTNIAWESDINDKFANPEGFKQEECTCPVTSASCTALCGNTYDCNGPTGVTVGNAYEDTSTATSTCWAYQYPDDATTQYLFESYPLIIAPAGPSPNVKNELFINWMRTAGLPKFRKLIGSIDTDIKAGEKVYFDINANFDVASFEGSKSLVISTVSWFGGKNPFLGQSYIAVGSICVGLALIFGIKHMVSPRKLGDTRYLVWKEA